MTAPTSMTFLGGAGTVTGSKTLLVHGGHRLLVDCGLFQGTRELRRQNWAPLPVAPAGIDAVVLSHAHLDHCGYLPALVRQGFDGRVLCTAGTAELAAIVLRDSAKLAEEEARDARVGGWSRHSAPQPLYDEADAEKAIALLEVVPEDHPVEAVPGVVVELPPAGHILGSAMPVVRVECGPADRRPGPAVVAFSGDLGRPGHPLLLPPGPPPAADALVVESTYGDRRHPEPSTAALADAVRRTAARDGVLVVPAFAVDRTEVVLLALADLMRSGAVPTLPVYLDSPMALAALRVYRQALSAGAGGLRPGPVADVHAGFDPFETGDLREARSAEESMRLNSPGSPCIILSASGMASGGRVVHHLAHLLPDRRNTVLLVGYQAVGTRGRALVEGATEVKIHGKYVPVRAEVVALDEFSVHADADDILAWLRSSPREPEVCYLVHGEPDAAATLAARVRAELGWCAVVPRPGERVLVG
ncbi:MBL fold metallo-hydrolase RNA specificity domain-containing protein [Kineosporia sp. R_H_3]|uniref:MBL fold metallo-hydrolase RNA specificity domain-containing protein n=1 Tax=Kineosporia sp. R_H_3 TaxID=1961848 RepID=UPI000B4B7155|nr:MBL fold metallo-hydrolase [Kineosporia sp. R_H_3]